MARGADKARLQRNASILRALRIGAATILSLYALLQLVVLRRWNRPWVWAALLVHGAGYAGVLWQFQKLARPSYDSAGRLTNGGADLMGGALSHVYDLCYVTAATLLLSVWSPMVFWADLVIPGYGLVRACKSCSSPLLAASPEAEEGSTGPLPPKPPRITVRDSSGRERVLRVKG